MKRFLKSVIVFGLILPFFLFPREVLAALSNVKDTISTSRPSASTPINEDLSATSTNVTVLDNGSRFIASDSAKLIGGTLDTVIISTMSAVNTPVSGQRVIYFADSNANTHNKGTVIMTPVTAKHTVNLTTTAIPSGGKIQIFFPIGDTTNEASPSASGFSFNGLQSTNIGVSAASCSTITVTSSAGKVECTLASALSGSNNEVIITVGSTFPTLINPVKIGATGVSDNWQVRVVTQDDSGVQLDEKKIKIGTIESVQIYGTVEPTFSFTIEGKSNGGNVNVGNTGCSSSDTINTGFNSTSTDVNFGVLTATQKNISAQLLTVSTNASGGYALTATSSGHFSDASIGYWINDAQGTPDNHDSPAPAVITAGTPGFGIHPCGVDVSGSGVSWGDAGGAGAKYANPSPAYYYTLAKNTSGPITNSGDTGKTTVEYSAAISYAVPAGFYQTVITYVATPTF